MGTVDLSFALTFAAALGSGLMAGAFYTFSAFVMRALGRLPARDGLAAMQSINVAAITPLFMLGFIGTALLALGALGAAALRWRVPEGRLAIAGAVLYLGGCFAVTAARNVPLNDTLAALDPVDPASADRWSDYLVRWTAWNHLRTLAALAAAAAFTLALVARVASARP